MKSRMTLLSKISGATPDNCQHSRRSFTHPPYKGMGSFSLRLRAEYPGTALIRRLDAGAPLSPSMGSYCRKVQVNPAKPPSFAESGSDVPNRWTIVGCIPINTLPCDISFSHSTSPAMVPTSQGIAATVEEGTAPKPVQVIARVQRYSGDARLMSVSGATNPGSDTTQMTALRGTLLKCFCECGTVFSTLPIRLSTMRGVGFRSRRAALAFAPRGFNLRQDCGNAAID